MFSKAILRHAPVLALLAGGTALAAPTIRLPAHQTAERLPDHFGKISNFSLETNSTEPPPLIRNAVIAEKAPVVPASAQARFSAAPLPDDDMEEPQSAQDYHATSVRPDFFRRNAHQVGDALAGGAADNEQRRGHGSMAGGLSVAVPMD